MTVAEAENQKNSEPENCSEISQQTDFYHLYFEPVGRKSFDENSGVMDGPNRIVTREPRVSTNFYKIVVVGDYGVGKSSVVARLCEDYFRDTHATTVGIDYKVRTVTMPNDKRKIKLELFDTAGLDKFRTVASNYYQNASGVAVVYDITDENSFENVENYLRELRYFIPPDAEILLIGNKADLATEGERRVDFKMADAFSAKMGLSLFEVSAKTGENVDAAFVELAQKIREKIEVGTFDERDMNGSEVFVNGQIGSDTTKPDSEGYKSKSSWMFWCCASLL